MDTNLLAQYIIIIFAALVLLVNTLSVIKKIITNKKFIRSQIVVRLKAPRAFLTVFIIIFALLIAAAWFFEELLTVKVSLTAALAVCMFYMYSMQYFACGITKEALFVSGKEIEWHNIYDYYIDKTRRKVIFSNNVKGGLTLKGLTPPLRYEKNDEETLEKFLEGHKGKYFKRIIIR